MADHRERRRGEEAIGERITDYRWQIVEKGEMPFGFPFPFAVAQGRPLRRGLGQAPGIGRGHGGAVLCSPPRPSAFVRVNLCWPNTSRLATLAPRAGPVL